MRAGRLALTAAALGAAALLLWNFVGSRPAANAVTPDAPPSIKTDSADQADPSLLSDRAEVPVPSINPVQMDWRREAMEVLLCTHPLASGKPTAAFLADCRMLGERAAELLGQQLGEMTKLSKEAYAILHALGHLGPTGAPVEGFVRDWALQPDSELLRRDAVKALLALGTAEATRAAIQITEFQADRVMGGGNVETQQTLGKLLRELGYRGVQGMEPLLLLLSDHIVMFEDVLAGQRAARSQEEVVRNTEISILNDTYGHAVTALALCDSEVGVDAIERIINAPSNASQRRYALTAVGEAVNANPDGKLAAKFGPWAKNVVLAAGPASDPVELAAALQVVDALGSLDRQALEEIERRHVWGSADVGQAWSNALRPAADAPKAQDTSSIESDIAAFEAPNIRLMELQQLSAEDELDGIAEQYQQANRRVQINILARAAQIAGEDTISLGAVVQRVCAQAYPLELRTTLLRSLMQRSPDHLDPSAAGALLSMAKEAANQRDCYDVLSLLAVATALYPDSQDALRTAVETWVARGEAGPCACNLKCLDPLREHLGSPAETGGVKTEER